MIALLIHGWPCYFDDSSMLVKFLKKSGYKVIAPKLFLRNYDEKSIFNHIKKSLGGKKPDLIIGQSLGGIIAQKLSLEYPESKLILIATGPYFKPKAKPFFKFLFKSRSSDLLFFGIKVLPIPITKFFYTLVTPFMRVNHKEYKKDMINNLRAIKKIKYKTYREIFQFAISVNNENVLNKIKNKTLIITGKKDIAMPLELSVLLYEKIPDSKILIYDKSHHNLIDKDSIEKIKKFVK